MYKLPQKPPNQIIALNIWGQSDARTNVRLNIIKVKVINHVEVINHLMQITQLSTGKELWSWSFTLNVDLQFQLIHWMDAGKKDYGQRKCRKPLMVIKRFKKDQKHNLGE